MEGFWAGVAGSILIPGSVLPQETASPWYHQLWRHLHQGRPLPAPREAPLRPHIWLPIPVSAGTPCPNPALGPNPPWSDGQVLLLGSAWELWPQGMQSPGSAGETELGWDQVSPARCVWCPWVTARVKSECFGKINPGHDHTGPF